jgi:hypothetical protein
MLKPTLNVYLNLLIKALLSQARFKYYQKSSAAFIYLNYQTIYTSHFIAILLLK